MSKLRPAQLDSGLAITMEEGNAEEQSDMAIARQIAHALNKHYPDHLWQISVQGGGIVLRHAAISMVAAAFLKREGFAYLMPREKMCTPHEIEQSAVSAGGNMLELFGIPRGKAEAPTPEAMVIAGLVKIPKDWVKRQVKNFA
jgi:hypothetical protein